MKPTFPAAARAHTDAGAVAFVEYYWAAVNYAWTKPDGEFLTALASSDCRTCAAIESTASNAVAKGEYSSAPALVMHDVTFVSTYRSKSLLACELQQPKAEIIDNNGKVLYEQKSKTLRANIELLWDGEWKVAGIAEI